MPFIQFLAIANLQPLWYYHFCCYHYYVYDIILMITLLYSLLL